MGNTCIGPKNLGNNGFLQSVTNAVWKTQQPETLPAPNDKNESSVNSDGKGSGSTQPKLDGQNTPPTPLIIASDSTQPKLDGPNTPPTPLIIASDGVKSPEPQKTTSNANEIKPVEGAKQNQPNHVKRLSSIGLQVESVLQRKTENLKEIYSLGRKLGQGQFGTTFFCLEKETGKEFACKSIAKRKLTTKEDVEDVRREIQIMHHLAGHPNVISIIGAYEDAVAVHVVMELCAGGELFDRIVQRGHYTERKAANLARTIVGVVEACHSLGVMHRDLKPENFLFVNEEEESSLKAIDFGLSMFFRPGILLLSFMFASCIIIPMKVTESEL